MYSVIDSLIIPSKKLTFTLFADICSNVMEDMCRIVGLHVDALSLAADHCACVSLPRVLYTVYVVSDLALLEM